LRAAPDRVGALIDDFTKNTVPKLKQIDGNVGNVLLVNREAGDCVALTYWRDRSAMDASEAPASGLRTSVATNTGATVEEVARYEMALMERTAPPQAGHYARSVRFTGDAARIDEGVSYLRTSVVPQFKQINGFRAVICGVDRQAGRGIVTTVWESLADLRASESTLKPVRDDVMGRFGARDVTVDIYESVYVEIAATALI
jgi:heme-degrading monooxygenase HmoA